MIGRMNVRHKVTIRDVAKVAGVSKSTVSLVLQESQKVAETTRRKVLQAMLETGYIPNASARNLVAGKTRVIGLATENFSQKLTERIYFSSTVGSLLESLRAKEYHLMIYNANLPLQLAVDAMLFHTLNDMKHQLFAQVKRVGLPYALVNRRINDPEVAYISHDFTMGGQMATEHLLGLGHKNIGIMTGLLSTQPHRDRFNGYIQALNKGIPQAPEDIVFETRDLSPRDGYRGTEALLSHPKRPTALFVSNYELLPGVLEYCKHHDIRIPEDLSLVCFDDPWAMSALDPPMTAVRPNNEELGQASADLIVNLAEGCIPQKYRQLIKPTLVIRESTLAPRATTLSS